MPSPRHCRNSRQRHRLGRGLSAPSTKPSNTSNDGDIVGGTIVKVDRDRSCSTSVTDRASSPRARQARRRPNEVVRRRWSKPWSSQGGQGRPPDPPKRGKGAGALLEGKPGKDEAVKGASSGPSRAADPRHQPAASCASLNASRPRSQPYSTLRRSRPGSSSSTEPQQRC